MGYQATTPENSSGYSFITPTFKDVGAGTATYNLQNLKLLGEFVGDGVSDYIEVWTDAGAMSDTAYYYVTEENGYDHDGWVTEMAGDVYAEGVTYAPGQGFFLVVNSGDDVQMQLPAVLAAE